MKFQTSQPIVAHIAQLIISASTHGHGEEYRSAGPCVALVSRVN
jgi:hypothetical protein